MSWDYQHWSKVNALPSWQVRVVAATDRWVHRANPMPPLGTICIISTVRELDLGINWLSTGDDRPAVWDICGTKLQPPTYWGRPERYQSRWSAIVNEPFW